MRAILSGDAGRLERHAIDGALYLACQPDAPQQRLYDRWLGKLVEETKALLSALEGEGCSPFVWKGVELVPRSFGGRAFGASGDIDVLVRRELLPKAIDTLRSLGFEQCNLPDPREPVLVPRTGQTGPVSDASMNAAADRIDRNYAVAPFMKLGELRLPADEARAAVGVARSPGGPLAGCLWPKEDGVATVLVEVDLHYRTSNVYAPEALLERGQPSWLGIGRTLSHTDHVWAVLFKWYMEVQRFGTRSLRLPAIVAAYIARHPVDWGMVENAAETLQIEPCLYYPLALLERLGGGGLVPAGTLERLRPGRVESALRPFDFGWQLDKLFGRTQGLPEDVARD